MIRETGAVQAVESAVHVSDAAVGISAQRKASWHLLPIIGIGYGLAYVDRVNISFAALRMNADLHFSATIYGTGAGLFFIAYALCEIPSNLLLLRFGPRRWLARIMFTWGLLAAAMMFVRTPMQFYVLRFLLGIAEAGFFPGVVYYLTLFFPVKMRARAVSRFYVSFPLASIFMGSLAGWLLGLDGRFGLAGWQWLFLAEGLPAVAFSLVVLKFLPDTLFEAPWLNEREKEWLRRQLDADMQEAHLGPAAAVTDAIFSPKVWLIGGFFFFSLTSFYAYNFSAPIILQIATGWDVTRVGYLVASFGLLGAIGMLLNSIHSDRSGERALHCIIPCILVGIGFVVASYATQPWLQVAALALSYVMLTSVQGPAVSLPTQFLAGRAAAAGIAAMNTITMFSGFLGPYWMGRAKDTTGTYALGIRALVIPAFAAAAMMWLLARSLKRSDSRTAETEIATEQP